MGPPATGVYYHERRQRRAGAPATEAQPAPALEANECAGSPPRRRDTAAVHAQRNLTRVTRYYAQPGKGARIAWRAHAAARGMGRARGTSLCPFVRAEGWLCARPLRTHAARLLSTLARARVVAHMHRRRGAPGCLEWLRAEARGRHWRLGWRPGGTCAALARAQLPARQRVNKQSVLMC